MWAFRLAATTASAAILMMGYQILKVHRTQAATAHAAWWRSSCFDIVEMSEQKSGISAAPSAIAPCLKADEIRCLEIDSAALDQSPCLRIAPGLMPMPVAALGRQLDPRARNVPQPELALHVERPAGSRVAQHPVVAPTTGPPSVGTLERCRGVKTVRKIHHADHSTAIERAWYLGPANPRYLCGGVVRALHASACVNRQRPSVVGFPGAVLDGLPAKNDGPCPDRSQR